MKPKAFLYLRCSTSMQSVGHQRKSLEDYCKRNDWKVCGTYDDSAVSGMKDDRKALNQLLDHIRKGRIREGDLVVCYAIDRLGRSLAHLIKVLTEFEAAGVHFCATSQGINTSTTYGSMLAKFLGILAEFEHAAIVSRVKSGVAKYRADHPDKPWGRRRVGFDVNECLALKRQGMSWSKLARHAGVSASTLQRTLYPLLKDS